MKILFLMFAFPDMNTSFNMYTSLVEEFHNNGHEVFVVAPGKSGKKTEIVKEAKVNVLRVKTLPLKNVPNFVKGIANLLLPYQYKYALKKYFNFDKVDLIVIPTPPIFLVNLAAWLKERLNSKIYLILRDIFPQNAVDMGFIKKDSIGYRYFRKLEEKLYRNADYIGCMSEGNIQYIQTNNKIDTTKLHILRNLQKTYDLSQPKRKELLRKFNIEGKFIAVFGGNIGKPQKIENILELAKRCENLEDVIILILGEGTQKWKLDSLVKEMAIKNVLSVDTIPKQDYQDLLRQCHVGLISLHENFTIPNIPSKTLDYFNLGIPVLASIDKSTDYGRILKESGAGLWSYAGQHAKFKENFDILYKSTELRNEMGGNGRSYFEKYLSPDIAYKTVISQVT